MNNDPSLLHYVELHQQILSIIIKSNSLSFKDEIMLRVFRSEKDYKFEMTSESNISFYFIAKFTSKELTAIADQELGDYAQWFSFIFSGEFRYALELESSEQAKFIVEQV